MYRPTLPNYVPWYRGREKNISPGCSSSDDKKIRVKSISRETMLGGVERNFDDPECNVSDNVSDDTDTMSDGSEDELHVLPPGLGTNKVDIHDSYADYVKYTQHAVDEYNRRFKDMNGELELVKIKEAKLCIGPFYLYVTFDAAYFDGKCKVTRTYQAWVHREFNGVVDVPSFRLKPREHERENNETTWFWTDGQGWVQENPPSSSLPFDCCYCSKCWCRNV